MLRKTLLACGILSSLLYVAMNIYVASQWPGYSSFSQVVSELSAIDSPTRSIWVPLGFLWGTLLLAFTWGVWRSAGGNRPLRIAGALLIAYAIFGFFWPPMHLRPVLAAGGGTLTDILHIVWTAVEGCVLVLAMSFAAAAFGRRFRVYSIGSIVLMLALGYVTGTYAAAIEANLPTPGVGLWERLLIGLQMLWIAVLSTVLLRSPVAASTARRESRGFKTAAGEAAFMAAYDDAMKHWPVPYDEVDIPSRFGSTHVIACGPKDAPPLVLLHGYMATSVMWAPNVADFSRHFRVYAIDVVGQPGKTIPRDPIRSAIDYVTWLNTTLNGLRLNRFALAGQSFGGWVALEYAIAEPYRVDKLVLLSPGGLLPLARQFALRGMLMTYLPTRFTVNSFMHWIGLTDAPGETDARAVLDLMYLGMKHFGFALETLRVTPSAFSHGELTSIYPPTLVLIGEREVIYNPAKALERALDLIPDVRGELIPRCSHDMVVRQRRLVDARVIEFLTSGRTGKSGKTGERAAA
ncbi:MAG TPA: alpha/beta fold hydrolase [Vicinamibacterales bacterium]|jgi:pimeloyl-ACP methyl ester carboxylesterase|nr:alpha/beta fold hydrolase [Vicinamibacterales bacterium]